MDEPRTNLRRSRRFPLVILVAGGVLAGGYGLWLTYAGGTPTPTAAAADSTPPPAPLEPPKAAAVRVEEPVDAAAAKSLLESVSRSPLARRWLSDADLVRRTMVLTDNVAEGVSSRRSLSAWAPASPFSVARSGDGFVIAPESYSRYDQLAQAIESIDAQVLATAYRRLHFVLESAYRSLGHPDASLDRVVSRALERLEGAPVVVHEIPVEPRDGAWVYTDARLERLPDVEKHLLRMGPRNARMVQWKVRELREALQLPEQVAAGAM